MTSSTQVKGFLSNWTFRRKLYAVFTLGLFGNILLIISILILINLDAKFTQNIKEDALHSLQLTTDDFRDLSDIHSKLFNVIDNAKSHYDEETIYNMGSAIIDRMDILSARLTKEINSIQPDSFNSADHEILIKEISTYRESTVSIIEMLSVDPGLSQQYLVLAVNSYNRINLAISNIMGDINSHINADMDERITEIKRLYWPLVSLVSLLSIGLAFFLMKIISGLTNNFAFIENSLNRLRQGDTDFESPNYSHDKNMNTLASGIERFRKAIIDSKRDQQILTETNQQLQLSLSDLTKAKEAAESSSLAKTNFLANMSHEVRTPLNAIASSAQLLALEEPSKDQAEFLDIISQSSEHLTGLLTSFLEYARYSSKDFKLDYQPIDFRILVKQIMDINTEAASTKGLSVHANVDDAIPEICYGDPLRIQQILNNLIDNAIKFSHQGEINVRVIRKQNNDTCESKHCPRKNLSNRTGCDWVVLQFEIEDKGIGLAEDIQQSMFDLFSQADESLTRKYGGTGIGLAITKQLVDIMDGTIGVRSTPGEGSVFWFSICLSPHAPEELND